MVANSLKVELGGLRRSIDAMPQKSDLRAFRAEFDVDIAKCTRMAQEECANLSHNMNMLLSERDLTENEWKSQFDTSMGARIQDVWSGMHGFTKKLQDNMQMLQTDMIKQEEVTREVTEFVDQIKSKTLALERDTSGHASKLDGQASDLKDVHQLCLNLKDALNAHELDAANRFGGLASRLNTTDSHLQIAQAAHQVFVDDTGKTLANLHSDISSCQSNLEIHRENLELIDAGITRQAAESMQMTERMDKTDIRIGGIDGRVMMSEKKLNTMGNVLQEHYQEMQHLVTDLRGATELASQDRTAMKRVATDLSFSLQETQHTLHEIGKLTTTNEQGLARAAGEIPKLHALVTNNSANIAKNRQTIRDLTTMAEDEKSFSQALQFKFEKEVTSTVTRFEEATNRHEETQQAIADAENTTMNIKHTLEEAIRYNGNMVHQLGTMVDSIAVTESAEGMEDKMAKFALSCAELGLKLEHFGKNASSSNGMHVETKTELALLLTKVLRFLGSGVSIDQNRYLLTAKRTQHVDPSSGAVIVELPPQQVLEGFRTAKVAAYIAKTRVYMDQMQPVMATNKYAMEFRDNFERRLQFVLEFGLANMFPNAGRPQNPNNKRGGEFGTCIACDRPIDGDDGGQNQHQNHSNCGGSPRRAETRSSVSESTSSTTAAGMNTPEPENSASSYVEDSIAEEHRLRRQRILAGAPVFASNPIDTKSVVPGRSGAARGVRPKSGNEVVHHTPGKADYIYRGGFRIPKSTLSSTPTAANLDAALLSGVLANGKLDDRTAVAGLSATANQQSLMDGDGSRLEKVALLGRCQSTDNPGVMVGPSGGSSAISTRASLVRPHTAPNRAKSLPRLEPAVPSPIAE